MHGYANQSSYYGYGYSSPQQWYHPNTPSYAYPSRLPYHHQYYYPHQAGKVHTSGGYVADSYTTVIQQVDEVGKYRFEDDGGTPFEITLIQDLALGGAGHTGGIVWQASKTLAERLCAAGRAALDGLRVLEVGAGTGLVGMVAAAMGAHVVVSDQAPLLPLLRKNVEANAASFSGSCTVAELDWGPGGFAALDALGPFDLVVGSDVTYTAHDLLCATLRRAATAMGATVVLSHTRRFPKNDEQTGRALVTAAGLAHVDDTPFGPSRDVAVAGPQKEVVVMCMRARSLHGDVRRGDDVAVM